MLWFLLSEAQGPLVGRKGFIVFSRCRKRSARLGLAVEDGVAEEEPVDILCKTQVRFVSVGTARGAIRSYGSASPAWGNGSRTIRSRLRSNVSAKLPT